jgi:hypothetical protein
MLQDAIWADGERLDNDEAYIDLAARFVAASLEGWIYCRDNVQACTDIVVAKGSKLGASHQLWQMNEINKLIWPSPDGIGFIDQGAWDRTVEIAMGTPNLEGTTVLTAPPSDGAWTNDIVGLALQDLQEAGLDVNGADYQPVDVTLVQQQFDMSALLAGDIDAAEAMTYNEYAQVLEAVNPDTGELYQPEDFTVISYEEVGVGMLQDAIWADAERLESDDAYRDIAVRFVTASLQGWAFCRDNVETCRDIVVAKGSKLGNSHQLWQMNEINKLIWPSDNGVGYIDQAAWDRTVEIAMGTPNLEGATVITETPTEGAWTNDIVTEALANLEELGVDTTGSDFTEIEVTLEEGGA